MSYDVHIGSNSFNYTSNGNALFYDHMPSYETVDDNGVASQDRGGIPGLDGLTGREAGVRILAGMESMNRERNRLGSDAPGEPEMCAKYDNPNGWGSLVGMLLFLGRIAAACAAEPDAIVSVSC